MPAYCIFYLLKKNEDTTYSREDREGTEFS